MRQFAGHYSKRTPILNAYVVVADVSLSLLMIIITYFVVSSHLTDAVNARKAHPIMTLSEQLLAQAGLQNLYWRNGNEVLYKFKNSDLFTGTALSSRGSHGMTALARTMSDPTCSPFVQDVRATVSEPGNYPPTATLQLSRVLSSALYKNNIGCRVISAARLIDHSSTQSSEFAETDIVVELK